MRKTLKKYLRYGRSKTVKAAVITMGLGLVEYQTRVIVSSIGGQYVGLIITGLGGLFLVLRAITTEALGDK